jgi:glucose-6-phosphate 1-dehydrogenase
MLFLNLIVESDLLNMITVLTDDQTHSTYTGAIVDECKNLLHRFHNLQLLHIRRVANQAAHYLGKCAIINLECVWIENTLVFPLS